MFINFTKMHGLGNDFMVIDLVSQNAKITPKQVKRWSDRHTGVGFDQLLTIEPPIRPDVDFYYRIFNTDGSEAEQCGNGARCIGLFLRQKRLITKKQIRIETLSGIIELQILGNNQIRVNMGKPHFAPQNIPFTAEQQAASYHVQVEEQSVELMTVSMGNPHAVIHTQNLQAAPVKSLGAKIETHPQFPRQTNVGFIQVINRQHAKLRVWERGVGETNACGTGACAAAVSAIQRDWLDSPAIIEQSGGKLTIEWEGQEGPVFMTGDAATIYEGKIQL